MTDTHSNFRDNSSRLKRNVSKIAFRSKEKVMRSIGRSEETKDEILEHYVMLINKQQIQMQKLQRDMKQYLTALKAMSLSHKAFYNSLYEVYEEEWDGKDVIASLSQRSQILTEDIFARFQSEVTDSLQTHLNEYHECKYKVEKRGRKLVDYDAAKRTLHSLQSAKKPDHAKIEKAEEVVRQARETYEQLNNHLHEQLPTLYDSRLPVCVATFSSICESERTYSSEVAEMRSKLNNVLLNLKASFDAGEYRIQRMHPPMDNGRVVPPTPNAPGESPSKSSSANDSNVPPRAPDDATPSSPKSNSSSHEYVNLQVGTMPDVVKPVTEEEENGVPPDRNDNQEGSRRIFSKPEPQSPTPKKANGDSAIIQPIYEEPPREEDLPSYKKPYQDPVIQETEPKSPTKSVDSHKYFDLPPDYLYSVQALYQYRSTDDDELTFEKGEIIHIVKYPDPEEQDEGWQMGVRQKDWEEKSDMESSQGVFPENFTKKIQL